VSIKIFRLAQILAGSCQKAWEGVKNEDRRLLHSSIVMRLRITPGQDTSNCSAGYPQRDLWSVSSLYCLIADLPHSVLCALCSLLGTAAPEPRVVLQSISLQPTQKVQEVRSDSLRSGNIAVLILVHAGGRLPSGSGTVSALPYSP